MSNDKIDFSDDKIYVQIKKAYNDAINNKLNEFIVIGYRFDILYAKYLLEHVDNIRKLRRLKIYNEVKGTWKKN